MDNKPRQSLKNRRKGPDWMVQCLHWLAVIGWVLFVVALGITHLARPEMNSGLVRYWDIQIRDYWDPARTAQLIYLLWWCCAVSLASISLNQFRLRRRTDRQQYNTVILLLISLAALSYFYTV
ncbi:MAG TPA: hypothetical protein DCS87_08605 [Rheinheimera sp.]|nr:hypothetical protein [Rheinheimera sp.]